MYCLFQLLVYNYWSEKMVQWLSDETCCLCRKSFLFIYVRTFSTKPSKTYNSKTCTRAVLEPGFWSPVIFSLIYKYVTDEKQERRNINFNDKKTLNSWSWGFKMCSWVSLFKNLGMCLQCCQMCLRGEKNSFACNCHNWIIWRKGQTFLFLTKLMRDEQTSQLCSCKIFLELCQIFVILMVVHTDNFITSKLTSLVPF